MPPKAMKANATDQPRYMTDCERRLALEWYNKDELAVEEIARRLRRSTTAIWDLLGEEDGEGETRGVGRKAALTEEDKDRLIEHTETLVKLARVRYTVTQPMIQAMFRPKVCLSVLAAALHERNVWFHRLREKPILTDGDIKARYLWSKKYRLYKTAWFNRKIQLHIDNHNVKVPTDGKARNMLAAKRVTGTYREPGKSLERHHVKPSSKARLNTGARGVLICGGVGAGKVLLWHVIKEQWCAAVAGQVYEGPMLKCLKKEYPGKRSWSVLEDNDPSGYQSKGGKEAKARSHIIPFEIPKRSPDLNVLDYYVWSAVEKKLREQELRMAEDKKETRIQFIARMRRAVKLLPAALIKKAIGDLSRRAKLLYKAKGGLFDEPEEL